MIVFGNQAIMKLPPLHLSIANSEQPHLYFIQGREITYNFLFKKF